METITLAAALAALTSDTTMASGNSVPFSVSESSAKKISLANLASVVVGQHTSIPANSDLNDYNGIGDYFIGTNVTATGISNNPSSTWGRLEVRPFVGASSRIQIFYSYQNPPRVWVRRSTDGSSWGSWSELTKVS